MIIYVYTLMNPYQLTLFQFIIHSHKGYIVKEAELCILVQKRVIFILK